MPAYHVEEMHADAVTTWHVIKAETPIGAARKGTRREVNIRTSETIWIRVTDEARGEVYEFCFAD
jgi:hypothetical protein